MTIWKYQLNIVSLQNINLAADAKILSVAIQNDTLCLWALTNPNVPIAHRTIEIVSTDMEVSPYQKRFIGTVQMGVLVWHVFERT